MIKKEGHAAKGVSLSGIGGVETGSDAAEFILLGSDTVQVRVSACHCPRALRIWSCAAGVHRSDDPRVRARAQPLRRAAAVHAEARLPEPL